MVELAGHRVQRLLDTFGIARADGEVGFGRLVRLPTALFPIPQSAERDVVARGKLLNSVISKEEVSRQGICVWWLIRTDNGPFRVTQSLLSEWLTIRELSTGGRIEMPGVAPSTHCISNFPLRPPTAIH